MKKVAVGVDIGGTNSAYGLVDEQGNILSEGVFPTRNFPDSDLYIEELCIGIQNLLKTAGEEYELIGVGIGAPNGNFYKGTIEFAPNLPWKGTVNLVEKMKRFFPTLPVIVTNDANAAAVGEMVYGGARGMKDFLVVTLGTGLGSGFVANGQLIYGHDGFAGELGHVTVSHTGRVCGCGRKGCLETYVSATGIKRTIFKLMADSIEDSEFRHVTFTDLTAEMITKAALNGDPLAIEAYEYTGMLLGRALADLPVRRIGQGRQVYFRADEEIHGDEHDADFPQQGEIVAVRYRREKRRRSRGVGSRMAACAKQGINIPILLCVQTRVSLTDTTVR